MAGKTEKKKKTETGKYRVAWMDLKYVNKPAKKRTMLLLCGLVKFILVD